MTSPVTSRVSHRAARAARPARRSRVLTVALVAAAALVGIAGPASAGPGEPELVAMANASRAAAGVQALEPRDDLTAIARGWAERMAATGKLGHNPAVGSQVCCWAGLAENVGYSYRGAADVHRLLMESSGHRGNLLNGRHTQVGIGTATDGQGRLWVTQVFRAPNGQAAPAPAVGPVGSIRDRWIALGAERSAVGAPVTGELTTPDRIGRYTHFRGGSIYWSPRTGAHEVYGSIRARWAAERWEAGRLGYPTRGEYDVPGGRATDFERGRIVWDRATGHTAVHAR